MTDMRGEEEAILQPHSQVRHELMHNQYSQMKEEDDHWQDVSVSDLSDSTLMFLFLSFLLLKMNVFAALRSLSKMLFHMYSVYFLSQLSCVRSLSVTQSDFSVCRLKHKLAQVNNFHRLL